MRKEIAYTVYYGERGIMLQYQIIIERDSCKKDDTPCSVVVLRHEVDTNENYAGKTSEILVSEIIFRESFSKVSEAMTEAKKTNKDRICSRWL